LICEYMLYTIRALLIFGRWLENRSQESEARDQKSEGRNQKVEDKILTSNIQ
jgi:hypothetical protein